MRSVWLYPITFLAATMTQSTEKTERKRDDREKNIYSKNEIKNRETPHYHIKQFGHLNTDLYSITSITTFS